VDRLVNKVDFERLLATRSRSRSAHFSVHHLSAMPSAASRTPAKAVAEKLSTSDAQESAAPVDNIPGRIWLGCIIPKRHARRAVTRNLLRRQARALFEMHAPGLRAGLWLLRLAAPFPAAVFVSARSRALSTEVRSELDGLLSRAAG
jgi:ribonuclease P protein component